MNAKYHECDDHVVDRNGRKWALGWIRPGVASDFLQQVDSYIAGRICSLVVLYARVSTPQQEQRGNLSDSMRHLRSQAKAHGFVIVGEFSEIANGADLCGRPALERAIRCARSQNAAILAESRCRFLRHALHTRTNASDAPTIAEFRALRAMAEPVQLLTLISPDDHARHAQVKRGQAGKGRMGGRPKAGNTGKGATRMRREKYLAWVCARRESGWSLRKIADELARRRSGFPAPTPKTVANWLKRCFCGV